MQKKAPPVPLAATEQQRRRRRAPPAAAADIVLNVESEHQGGMRVILQHMLEFFKEHPEFQVCTAKVEDYVYAAA